MARRDVQKNDGRKDNVQKPTSEDVNRYRNEKQCSVFEAHARLMKQYIFDELNEIRAANEPANAKIVRLIDLMLYALQDGPRG